MGETRTIYIIPLSSLVVGYAIFIIFILGGAYGVGDGSAGPIGSLHYWFLNNGTVIAIIMSSIFIINSVITGITKKSLLLGITSVLPSTQMIYFIIKGAIAIPVNTGFAGLWSTILLILYIVFSLINLLVVLFMVLYDYACGNECLRYIPKDRFTSLYLPHLLICGIGWIINLIFVGF